MKVRIAFAILILLSLFACATVGSGNSGEYGYLVLSGSMLNREARVDGNLVGVDPADDTQRVRLKAGSHILEIRSQNRVLLAEEIIIEAGKTSSITIP